MHEGTSAEIQKGRALTRTCIVDTPYALGLYLLKTELADYAETRFYVDQFMPPEIVGRLPNAKRMLLRQADGVLPRLRSDVLRLKCFIEHFRAVRHTQIFAQDHISCASRLIGGCPYTLIEDGPGIYSRVDSLSEHCRKVGRGVFSRLWSRTVHGKVFGHTCGRNPQCVSRWVTRPADLASAALSNRRVELVDVRKLWVASSPEKQSAIIHVFCGGRRPDADAAQCETLFLTQPLMEDCGLTEKETAAVYAPFVERYRSSGMAVKIHPRDRFCFTRHFPDVKLVDTLLPMQLLCLAGVKVRRVVTVCSSAADSLPPEIEVVRIGTSANPKMVAAWGIR